MGSTQEQQSSPAPICCSGTWRGKQPWGLYSMSFSKREGAAEMPRAILAAYRYIPECKLIGSQLDASLCLMGVFLACLSLTTCLLPLPPTSCLPYSMNPGTSWLRMCPSPTALSLHCDPLVFHTPSRPCRCSDTLERQAPLCWIFGIWFFLFCSHFGDKRSRWTCFPKPLASKACVAVL